MGGSSLWACPVIARRILANRPFSRETPIFSTRVHTAYQLRTGRLSGQSKGAWYCEEMPGFHPHPLTWLFFTAAACLVAVDQTQSRSQDLSALILTGLVIVAGAWAAVGPAHRLARGAVLVIAPYVIALPFCLTNQRPDEIRAVLAMACIAVVVSFVAAMLTRVLLQPWTPATPSDQRWRISISEILGWTLVTAIASVAINKALIPEGMSVDFLHMAALGSIPSSAAVALFLVPHPRHDEAAAVLSAGLAIVCHLFDGGQRPGLEVSALLLGFVGLWILCVRLDEGADVRRAGRDEQASLKIHEGPPVEASGQGE